MKTISNRFVALMAVYFICSSLQAAQPLNIIETDIRSIHAAYKAGTLSAEELTRAYLERIQAYDKNGPKLNSFIMLNPEALDVARALDKERKNKGNGRFSSLDEIIDFYSEQLVYSDFVHPLMKNVRQNGKQELIIVH